MDTRVSIRRLRRAACGWSLVVLSLASTASAQEGPFQVTEARRIGPSEVELASITDVAVDGRGAVWIADGQAGELLVARADGITTLAAAGDGPGELAPGPIELVVLTGDTVLVVQPHAARISRFGPDGTFVETTAIGAVDGLTSGWSRGDAGLLVARVNLQTMMPRQAPESVGDPLMQFETDGTPLSSIATLSPSESFRMGPGGRPTIVLLAPQPVWSVAPDGVVLLGSTDAYRVDMVDPTGPTGTLTRLVERDVPVGQVGPELAERARELLRETLDARRLPPAMADQLVAAAEVADRAPVIGGLLAGPQGTVWVQRAAARADELAGLERPGGPRWDVFRRDGAPLGTVTLPARFRPSGFHGRQVVGVEHDDLGRASAVVLSVQTAEQAGG